MHGALNTTRIGRCGGISAGRSLLCHHRPLSSSSSSRGDDGDSSHENLAGASIDIVGTMYRADPHARHVITHANRERDSTSGEQEASNDEDETQKRNRQRLEASRGHRYDVAASRKYLSHPGVGDGTVFDRERLAVRKRMADARHKVHQHNLKKLGVVSEDVQGSEVERSLRAQKGLGALVEDRIQLSMIQGDFDSLPSRGKPLERERTPGLDRTTDLFMDILRRNGIKPEWIERQKRIHEMTALLRRRLDAEWQLCLLEANSSATTETTELRAPCPVQFRHRVHALTSVREDMAHVNREVDTYNLQVPSLHLQRLRVKLDMLIDETIATPASSYQYAELTVRSCRREGIMGMTCLIEYRADSLGYVLGLDMLHGSSTFFEAPPAARRLGALTADAVSSAADAHLTFSSSASSHGYAQITDGSGGRGQWHGGAAGRKRKEISPTDRLFNVFMLPIDGFARFLSRALGI